jgi:uncharacterized protein (DUF924 family)
MNYQAVLDFWFGQPEDVNYGQPLQLWFTKSIDTDLEITYRFQTTY